MLQPGLCCERSHWLSSAAWPTPARHEGGGKLLWFAARVQHAASPPGYLWNLQVKLQPIVNLLPDKGRLVDFLLQRKECKVVILSVCSQSE